MGGCDKTVPAMLMGAISADIPSIFFPAGPMLKAYWRKETLGSGSDAWKYWAERCAGNLCDESWQEIENCIARSAGTCMTMGTASTMAILAETLGFTLKGASGIPAVVAEHQRLGVATGRRAVELAWSGPKPTTLCSRSAFDDAVTILMAIGGSTNAIVHLLALAGRAQVPLNLDRFDELSRRTPVLADIRPGGRFLMEDFHQAGGLPSLMNRLTDLLHLDRKTVSGITLAEQIEGSTGLDDHVIRPRDQPLSATGGLCVLHGNLAPEGCVIKTIAATERLLQHRGPAVVFEDYPDLKKRIDDPQLPVTPDSVIVLKSAGPLGAPGMPEWGMLPIPGKLLKDGVRDMLRISDARMSGTSYGTCVLHVSPESHLGGPLAIVKDGDLIELDTAGRRLELCLTPDVMERRLANWERPQQKEQRGYQHLFGKHVTQAHEGCDFDFLRGRSPAQEPDIF
jgi:dihydroxy-acid dehydratase